MRKLFRSLVMSTTVTVCASASSAIAPSVASQRAERDSLSQKAYDEAESVFQQVTSTRYKHNHLIASQQVEFSDGGGCRVDANCSSFVGYILDKVARAQYDAIRQFQPNNSYPRARSYASFFNSLTDTKPTHGWLKVSRYADLQRGDLIAWEKHLDPGQRGNSGHVMFVVQKPEPIEVVNDKRYVTIQVLDCSSVTHFPPEILPPKAKQTRRDGLGKGCVRLLLDEADNPIGYWEGTYSGERDCAINHASISRNIAFARLAD